MEILSKLEEKQNTIKIDVKTKIANDFDSNSKKGFLGGVGVFVLEVLFLIAYYLEYLFERQIKTENRNFNKVKTTEPLKIESPDKITLESLAIQVLLNQIQGGQPVQFQPLQSQNAPQKFGFQFKRAEQKNTFDDTKNEENHISQRETSDEKSLTKNVNDGNRICKNCQAVYVYRHWNQKYCSDACRIENWEKRTGKKVQKKKKGGSK